MDRSGRRRGRRGASDPGRLLGLPLLRVGGCRLPSTFVYDPLLQRADTDLLAALHYDYTLPKAAEEYATGNYGILENDACA